MTALLFEMDQFRDYQLNRRLAKRVFWTDKRLVQANSDEIKLLVDRIMDGA